MFFLRFFFLMIRPPPRSTRTDTSFPTRRSSDLDRRIQRNAGVAPPDPLLGPAEYVARQRVAVGIHRRPLVGYVMCRRGSQPALHGEGVERFRRTLDVLGSGDPDGLHPRLGIWTHSDPFHFTAS